MKVVAEVFVSSLVEASSKRAAQDGIGDALDSIAFAEILERHGLAIVARSGVERQ